MKKADIETLKRRLAEAEDALRAIREGDVDAVVVSGTKGERVFSLSETESIYRLMVETMSEAGLAVTPDGVILFANNCLVGMLGLPLEQVVGRKLSNFISPVSRPRLSRLLSRARTAPAKARLVLMAKRGAAVPVHAWANLLERPDGPTICLVGVDLSQLETSKELIAHLKEQRRALMESERRFRSLFESMTEGFAVHQILCDKHGRPLDYRFLEINPAFERLTGLKRADVVGKLRSRIPQLRGDDPGWVREYGRVALTGRPARFEQYSPALKRHYSVYAYRPAPRRFAVIFSDITDRKRIKAEQERLHTLIACERERLRALLDSVGDEIWFMDTDGTFSLMNPSAIREFKIDPPGAVNLRSLVEGLEILRPDGSSRPVEEAPALRALRGESVRNQDEIVRTPATGELRHRSCSSDAVRDAEGRIIGSVSVVRDVTEKVRRQRALRDSEEKYRLLFENMAEGFALYELIYDGSGAPSDWRVLEVNAAFAQHTGFAREAIVGRRASEVFPEAVSEYLPRFAQVVATQRPLAFETFALAAGRHQQVVTFPAGPDRFASTIVDITARKEAEEVLRRSREELEGLVRARADEIKKKDDLIRRAQKIEALGTLAGGIAHDFNNILSSILINAELALSESKGEARHESALPLVIDAVQKGRDLIKQIITFSRQREKELQPVRIGPAVRDALSLIRSSRPSNIELREDIDETAGVVMADPSQVHQIVANLCANAEHAMRESGGVLGIGLKAVEVDEAMAVENLEVCRGPYVRLDVTDTGCGMTPEIMDRIFDPFFTTKQPGEGTGLGLPVVHGIVKSYGGTITVASEPGRGSTFTVLIPRAEAVQEGAAVAGKLVRGAGERILLVDDEVAQLKSLTILLERLGYAVTPRSDGVEALATFEAGPGDFDLIITDQTMPRMSGGRLAQGALGIRPDIPIIMSTGYSEVMDAERAKLLGIREFVFKPFSVRDISVTIRRALGDPGQD
ncbi:MAG TPA: PAS domain S-box protein [Acidobacteriota bacterium]|nr:PAS domain S-box protein [Acidobacteriota bacterium]